MALITELRPELDPVVLAPCLVENPREVAWTLRQLEDIGGRIALFDPAEPSRRVSARLAAVLKDLIELAGNGEPLDGHGLSLGGRLLVVGHLRDIKIQFTISGATRSGTRNDPVLRCRLPDALYRIQRRGSHRVRIAPPGAMRLKMALVETVDPAPTAQTAQTAQTARPASAASAPQAAGAAVSARAVAVERVCPVVDLSTDGISFRWPTGMPVPPTGTRYGSVWLESADWEPIACWLEVVRVTGDEKTGGPLIGCQLGVAPESATMLARTLINLQRR